MSSIDYINTLAARGIQLWSQDGKLQYKAPSQAITPQLLAELKEHKATLIALLEQFAATAGSCPLSYSQKSLWSLHQLNPDSPAYNVTYAARLTDALDQQALGRCIDYLIARHPILRTRYGIVDGQPQQQVSAEASARLVVEKVFDASTAAIGEWIDNEANKPFDLTRSPIRLKLLVNELQDPLSRAPRYALLFNVHHIAADFRSLVIALRELQDLYRLAVAGQPLKLPALTLQYKDYVQHEIDRLQGDEGKALAAFWENELQGDPPTLNLATDHLRPPVKTENGKVHSRAFGAALSKAVKEAAKARHVTPYMLLLSVYQLFLFLHTGQSRLFVGAPTAGRNLPGSDEVLGHFVNTVVLACELRPEERFADLLGRTRATVLRVLDHQDYPFPLLVEKMRPPRDPSRSPVFQVMYNWNQVRGDADDAATSALIGEPLAASSTGTRGATHELTLNLQDDGSEYLAAWTFNTDLFDPATIERYAIQYLGLVDQVLDAEQALASYRLSAPAARIQALAGITQAAEPTSSLPAILASRARSHPARLAWQLGEIGLRYADLADAVQLVRSKLRASGVGAGSLVVVRLASVAELALTLLALLDLDAHVYLLDECSSASDDALDSLLQADAIVADGSATWDACNPNAITVVQQTGPGLPRAAWATAAQIGGFVEATGQLMELDETSRPLLLSGTDPRLAVAVMMMTVARGGSVCIPSGVSIDALAHEDAAAAAAAAQALGEWIARHRASTLAVPALLVPRIAGCGLARLESLLAYGEHPHTIEQLAGAGSGPASLRFLPALHFAAWVGPVAFSPSASGWRLQPSVGPAQVVLGPFGDLTDEHQAGRLHLLADRDPALHGKQDLATHWPQQRELTAALAHHRLVETPLVVTRRGRDMTCAHPSWRCASHRFAPFEIGPVESFIATQPEVNEVVCVVQEAAQGSALTAYVRPAEAAGSAAVFEDELRRRLKHRLPDYMQPQAIVLVERVPLTPDGRLDAQRLPRPQPRSTLSRAATTDLERKLAEIWCEVLALPAVGIDDDFFQLGGDSILAAVIVSKAGLDGLYLKPKDVFEHTTIAGLARVVSAVPQIQADQAAVTGEAAPGPASAWFFDKVDVDRSHFNQAVLIALHQAPDPALLRETLRLVAQQHDVLRSRFVHRDEGWYQVFDADSSVPPDGAAISCVGPDGADLRRQAIASVQASLDIEAGPLWTVRWLAGDTLADSRLLIVVHHLLIDGVSWNILLQDIADIYLQLQSHAAAKLPLKTSSSKAWAERWFAHVRSDAMDADRRYWHGFAERVQRTLASGSAVALTRDELLSTQPRERSGPMGSCVIRLDAELTSAFRTAAHQAYGTDANDLLLAALYAGFHDWNGSRALLLDLEGHGRDALTESIDLGRTIGWFTSIYPVLLAAPGIEEPARLIKQVKQSLREVPRKGAGFGVLRYLAGPGEDGRSPLAWLPPSPVLFNYLGQLEQMFGSSGLYAGAIEPAPDIRSPRQRPTHLLDICAYVSAGQLTIECSFDAAVVAEDGIGGLMQRIKTTLSTLIRHCCDDAVGGLTPSDVPQVDIDQDELDALLEEVAALEH